MEALRRTGRKGEGVFHRNQAGASALEFALVLPILVVLIFGAFSVGLGYNRRLALEHSARDAARYAATKPGAGDGVPADQWFAEVRDRALAAATGELRDGGADGTQICVAYVEGQVTASVLPDVSVNSKAIRYREGVSGWTADPSGTHCWVDGLGEPASVASSDLDERVQVEVSRPFEFSVVVLPPLDVTITAESVAAYERSADDDDT